MESREDAETSLREAVRIAESIEYPRAVWQALGLMKRPKTQRATLRVRSGLRAASVKR